MMVSETALGGEIQSVGRIYCLDGEIWVFENWGEMCSDNIGGFEIIRIWGVVGAECWIAESVSWIPQACRCFAWLGDVQAAFFFPSEQRVSVVELDGM